MTNKESHGITNERTHGVMSEGPRDDGVIFGAGDSTIRYGPKHTYTTTQYQAKRHNNEISKYCCLRQGVSIG